MAGRDYNERDIKVLKGLEPVRQRASMYTRTDSPLHIIQEVIDNGADEALAGYASRLLVRLNRDGSVAVADNGRGIPVGIHPDEGLPGVVVAFTMLHAGGKFDKAKQDSAYRFSGGLHGVGVAVTTALSERVTVEVRRDGRVHTVEFSNGGREIGPLTKGDACGKDTGTMVQVWPDGKYFDRPDVTKQELATLLRSKAALLRGVSISLEVELPGGGVDSTTWVYEHGLRSYLEDMCTGREPVTPMFTGSEHAKSGDALFAQGEGVEWVMAWYEGGALSESYVNLIPTRDGGTHESGFKAGVFNAVKTFVDNHAMLPRGLTLQQEDVASGLSFVLSATLLDPAFQGQVKDKLVSREAVRLVSQMVKDPVDLWLAKNVDIGRAVAELAVKRAMARSRASQKVERRKGSGVAVLPGKLTDCESTDIGRNEVFLVEGDSAGGSAKMARDKEFQAILPLRGKVQNSWEIDRDRLFANNEIHDVAVALGVDPHEDEASGNLSGLRYGKVIILSDADVDGAHIQTLLLTLFYKHFPLLIARGHVYIGRPPLFRIDVKPTPGSKQGRRLYALDTRDLVVTQERLRQEGVREEAIDVSRFKGLGEMNAQQLKETAMGKATRALLQVRADMDRLALDGLFNMLMSKGEPAARRQWMSEKGALAEVDA